MNRTRYCTVCQKPVQAIGGIFSSLKCPMCRNSGTLQRLSEESVGWLGALVLLVVIAVLAVVVGVGVVSSTRLGSHIRLWWTKSSTWAKEQVPLESEIERLRMEVSNLSQEDDRYSEQVLRQRLQVRKLRERITKQREALAKQEDYIKAMRSALAREEGAYVSFNGSRYERSRAEADVRNEAARFLANEKIVKADEEELATLEKTLAANEAELARQGLKRKEKEANLLILERELAQQRLKDPSSVRAVDEQKRLTVAKEIEEMRERFAALKANSDLRGETAKGSIRAEEERKAAVQKLDQASEARFGKSETRKAADGE